MTEPQKQNFLGGLVGSILLKKGAQVAIRRGMKALAKDDTISLKPSEVDEATAVITESVEREVKARVEHATDTEPHLSSRNLWGSVVGTVTAFETMRIFWYDGVEQTPTQWLVPVGILVAAWTPIYSRFFAKKPLFR